MYFFKGIQKALESNQQLRPEEERMAYNQYIERIRKSEFPMLKGASVLAMSRFHRIDMI
jgi:hypothetical protein